MGKRTDLPKVIPESEPTYWNAEAIKWGIIGAGAGYLLSLPTSSVKNPLLKTTILAAGAGLGAYYGSGKGYERQQQEHRTGRIVSDPTILNWGLLGGAIVGDFTHTMSKIVADTAGLGKIPSGMKVWLPMVGAGAMIGGLMVKDEMQRDFDNAVQIKDTLPPGESQYAIDSRNRMLKPEYPYNTVSSASYDQRVEQPQQQQART